ncbi:uncharacterized protein BXZ73DRAFT_102820 [Epithele typhae]|uniref:uncharacterized protein n=1 Tax=Epithele typhae TaxID=378194 RepID=UPI0020082DFB|nr:uncharacterized protein BXZ73DRAFT_102820 [Epithele typhae]KAH9926559.1 hypothetical protein BXZ73DRAFT_102820 [Epithele typhae]
MSSQSDIDYWISSTDDTITFQRAWLAATVLVLYDTLVTLGREIDAVWVRRPCWSGILYIFSRHFTTLSLLVVVPPLHTAHGYASFNTLSELFGICSYLSWAAFSAWRLYALADHTLSLALVVLALTSAYSMPNVYFIIFWKAAASPEPINCSGSLTVYPSLYDAREFYSPYFTGELIVIIATIRKTFSIHARRAGYNDPRGSIGRVLLENGIACFCIPTALNIIVFVSGFVSGRTAYTALANYTGVFRDGITSILISRYLLELASFRVHAVERAAAGAWDPDAFGGIMSTGIPSFHNNSLLRTEILIDDTGPGLGESEGAATTTAAGTATVEACGSDAGRSEV